MICNNNNKNEYYLTDIVKIIKDATNILINTYLLDEKYNMYISGVNTPKELTDLEYAFRTFT
jgi:bifunctional N-acetylglucosamine-1-phosphate-uridyltransferase/glucosamine-1-phosphate-acetyltransferase GlmU-like protein